MLVFLIAISTLIAVLSRLQIAGALLGLLKDRKELALFAVFLLVEIFLVAAVLAVFGPNTGGAMMLASIALFAIWVMRPPAQRR